MDALTFIVFGFIAYWSYWSIKHEGIFWIPRTVSALGSFLLWILLCMRYLDGIENNLVQILIIAGLGFLVMGGGAALAGVFNGLIEKRVGKDPYKKLPKKNIKKNPTSEEYTEMLDEIDRTYEGMKKDKSIPENKEAISEYFDKAIDWSDGIRNSHATGTVLSELKNIFDCDNEVINDELEWWERQKSTLDSYKTKDDLKELIKERLGMEIYSLELIEDWDEEDKPSSEEIESTAAYWSIGKSDEYKYKTEESFINDVNWDFVISRWSSAWDKACKK